MSKTLFYSDILMLSIEAYIEFLISGYLNMQTPLTTTNGEIISNFVGIYSVILCLVVLPAIFFYVLSQPISKFKDEEFHSKWEGMMEGVKTNSKAEILFYPLYALRRLIFCYAAFYLYDTPILQIIVCLLSNLGMLIYKGNYSPLNTRYRNQIELFNEWCIVLVHLHLIFYTEWMPDSSWSQTLGYS